MKKGFTLIELLAVIVILAIIALIATPIILNIIEDSKEQSIIGSAQLYVDGLQKRIASENMIREVNPSYCAITNGNVSCNGTSINYTVDGQKPSSGIIIFNNGMVTEYTLNIGEYNIVKSNNTETIAKGNVVVHLKYKTGQLVQYDPVNNTPCTTGDTCYKWRVIFVNDTKTKTNITLQMDHNLVHASIWISKADYNDDTNYGTTGKNNKGPITALKALETATSTWDDSLKLGYTYNTSAATNNYGILSCSNGVCRIGNNQITSNLKARMITGEEIKAITVSSGAGSGTNAYNWTLASGSIYYFSNVSKAMGTNSNGMGRTTLSWLLENTTAYTNSGATANVYGGDRYGYWTLSPCSGSANGAWFVHHWGDYNYASVNDGTSYGVRPVITLSKSIFE